MRSFEFLLIVCIILFTTAGVGMLLAPNTKTAKLQERVAELEAEKRAGYWDKAVIGYEARIVNLEKDKQKFQTSHTLLTQNRWVHIATSGVPVYPPHYYRGLYVILETERGFELIDYYGPEGSRASKTEW